MKLNTNKKKDSDQKLWFEWQETSEILWPDTWGGEDNPYQDTHNTVQIWN